MEMRIILFFLFFGIRTCSVDKRATGSLQDSLLFHYYIEKVHKFLLVVQIL
jgi:hypothetical protein